MISPNTTFEVQGIGECVVIDKITSHETVGFKNKVVRVHKYVVKNVKSGNVHIIEPTALVKVTGFI